MEQLIKRVRMMCGSGSCFFVTMKNGHEFRGIVMEVRDDSFVLNKFTDDLDVTIHYKDVASVC